MKVAEAILVPQFLDGSWAIEYWHSSDRRYGAYNLWQVSVDAEDMRGVYRHREFNSRMDSAWPAWSRTRGSGIGPGGFYGVWMPTLQVLLTECTLVQLNPLDRVPS